MSNTLKSSRNFQKRNPETSFQDTTSNNTVIINTTTSFYPVSNGVIPNSASRQTPNASKKIGVSKINNAMGNNFTSKLTNSGNPFTHSLNDTNNSYRYNSPRSFEDNSLELKKSPLNVNQSFTSSQSDFSRVKLVKKGNLIPANSNRSMYDKRKELPRSRSRMHILPTQNQRVLPSLNSVKKETPRWIQGVLVKDAGSQTQDMFRQRDYALLQNLTHDNEMDAATMREKEDDKYIESLFDLPFKDDDDMIMMERVQGPDADKMMNPSDLNIEDTLNSRFTSLSMGTISNLLNPMEDSIQVSSAKLLVRPVPVRLGPRSFIPPGTPLSERSATASLEDGSSSVPSFSTLASSISSPDSSKVANIMIVEEKSAFSKYPTNVYESQRFYNALMDGRIL